MRGSLALRAGLLTLGEANQLGLETISLTEAGQAVTSSCASNGDSTRNLP